MAGILKVGDKIIFSSLRFQTNTDGHHCLLTTACKKILHLVLGVSVEDIRQEGPDLRFTGKKSTDFCRNTKQNTKQVCNTRERKGLSCLQTIGSTCGLILGKLNQSPCKH